MNFRFSFESSLWWHWTNYYWNNRLLFNLIRTMQSWFSKFHAVSSVFSMGISEIDMTWLSLKMSQEYWLINNVPIEFNGYELFEKVAYSDKWAYIRCVFPKRVTQLFITEISVKCAHELCFQQLMLRRHNRLFHENHSLVDSFLDWMSTFPFLVDSK